MELKLPSRYGDPKVLMLAPPVVDPAAALTLSELGRLVCSAASRFDARQLDRDGAALATQGWSAIAHGANAALALAAARVAECGPPPSAGANDASEFVAQQTGTTTPKAKETISHGTRMGASAKTRRAATSGRLSPEQASAISDAAAVNPEAEDRLLAEAESSSVGELRQKCAKAKAERQDLETIERHIHARRGLRRYRDAEGAEHLHATGTKHALALIDQALKPLIDQQFHTARRKGGREPLEAYAFDALVAMAVGSLEGCGGDDRGGGGDRGGGAPKRRDPIRNLSVLRLDLSALVRGHVEGDETCEIAGLGPISVAVARKMLGESVLQLVLTHGIDVRTVTPFGRGPNAAQKIALLWEQPLCRQRVRPKGPAGIRPQRRARVPHHRAHPPRRTRPAVHPDHDLKTYQGWALVEGTGTRELVPQTIPATPAAAVRERSKADHDRSTTRT